MKKTISFLMIFFLVISLFAGNDNDILNKISAAGKKHTSVESKFTHIRTNAAKVKVEMNGYLTFKAPGQLKMTYTKPATDRFVLDGNKMQVIANGKEVKYDLTKNAPMKKLANFLCQAFTGQVESIATANNANYSIKDDGKYYVVTLTAKKKAAQGFARIVLSYKKTDCALMKMEMEEFNHLINSYELH